MNMFKKNILIPSLSGLLYGYNSSIIAGALLFITSQFSLTAFQEGTVVGISFIGAFIGGFSGILANYFGRKGVLLASALLFILSCGLSAVAPSYHFLLFTRLLVGLASGMANAVSTTYLIEVAPSEIRGSVLNLNQIGMALGALGAYFCSYIFASSGNWRLMLALGLIPAIIQLFGLFTIPDSCVKEERLKKTAETSWKSLFNRKYRSRFNCALLLSLFQALAGYSAIFYFAPRVFENCGFNDPRGSLLATLSIGIVNLIAILISFWLIDRLGRRPLLFISYAGMIASLLTIIISGLLHFPYFDVITLVCLLIYIAFCAIGVGPIPPLLIGEISPLSIRAHLMTFTGVMGWVANYFIVLTFLSLINILGMLSVFAIYAFFCLAGLLIFFKILPETNQKSLDEIDQLFE